MNRRKHWIVGLVGMGVVLVSVGLAAAQTQIFNNGSNQSSQINGSNQSSQINGSNQSSQINGSNQSSQINGSNQSSQINGPNQSSQMAQPISPNWFIQRLQPILPGPFLAFFGRGPVPGWTGWGNE